MCVTLPSVTWILNFLIQKFLVLCLGWFQILCPLQERQIVWNVSWVLIPTQMVKSNGLDYVAQDVPWHKFLSRALGRFKAFAWLMTTTVWIISREQISFHSSGYKVCVLRAFQVCVPRGIWMFNWETDFRVTHRHIIELLLDKDL